MGFAELSPIVLFYLFDLRGEFSEDLIESVPGHSWFAILYFVANKRLL